MSSQLLQSSAQELQQRLEAGELTSERLVALYLDQIDKHNDGGMQLKAVISAAPRQLALQRARELDLERSEGRLRSQLHGIPVILKVFPSHHFIYIAVADLAQQGLHPHGRLSGDADNRGVVCVLHDAGDEECSNG